MVVNTIYVGSKPVMNYVLAVVTLFNEENSHVIVRARGKTISKAVDTVEIVKNRFVQESCVLDIKIGTEQIKNNNDNEKINLSTIEILIEKK